MLIDDHYDQALHSLVHVIGQNEAGVVDAFFALLPVAPRFDHVGRSRVITPAVQAEVNDAMTRGRGGSRTRSSEVQRFVRSVTDWASRGSSEGAALVRSFLADPDAQAARGNFIASLAGANLDSFTLFVDTKLHNGFEFASYARADALVAEPPTAPFVDITG